MSVATIPFPAPASRPTHGFGARAPFEVGVEEELFLVDPHSLEVPASIDDLVTGARGRPGKLMPEICDGVIELVTPVCATAAAACAALRDLRAEVAAANVGTLLGVGVHPTAQFGDVCHRPGVRYDAISASTRSLLRQSAYCGVHIHVGMPDPETTIAAYNGMRKWIPLLQALGANSPFWHGRDSGLASTRTVLCHSVPRTGLPRAFRDWADYERTVDELLTAAELEDEGALWWDLRPHPRLGTLEVRALDAQSSLVDLEALVALVHCLVVHEATACDRSQPAAEVLAEATFRALRDGLDATFSLGDGVRPVRELAERAFHLSQGLVARLGCKLAIGHVMSMLARGNGAVRQRNAYDRGGMRGVLEHLARETVEGAHHAAGRGAAA